MSSFNGHLNHNRISINIRSNLYCIVKNMSTRIMYLKDKRIVEVRGTDTKKFLQGLCTNDVTAMSNSDCIAATFLSTKGRVLADTFLHYSTNEYGVPKMLIETHSVHADAIKRLLSVYKLRSNVTISSQTNMKSIFIHGSNLTDQLEVAVRSNSIAYAADPRVEGLGVRAIYIDDTHLPTNTADSYEQYRLLSGLAEGSELTDEIPLECNLDLLRYISFGKGCYIGQELIARTKYKGVVRKRILPFTLRALPGTVACRKLTLSEATALIDAVSADKCPAKHARVFIESEGSDKKEVGQIIHFDPTCGVGLVLLRLEVLGDRNVREESAPLLTTATTDGGELASPIAIYPYFPFWWPDTDPVTGKSVIPSDGDCGR